MLSEGRDSFASSATEKLAQRSGVIIPRSDSILPPAPFPHRHGAPSPSFPAILFLFSGKQQTKKLVRPREIFDPEVPELPSLLPESSFPADVFRQKDVLAALRPLGLQGALGWSGLVAAAASVEAMRRDGCNGNGRKNPPGAGGEEGGGASARARGRALLTYLDTHEVRLFELKKEASGLFQRMAKLVYTDPAAEERGRQRLAALHELMALSWVRRLLYI